MKTCSKCNKIKDESKFNKNTERKDGLRSECKDCRKIYIQNNSSRIKFYSNNYRKMNKNKIKAYTLQKYNITLEQYNEMLFAQNSVCYICNGLNTNGNALSVDHNHKTGNVRALLCHSCNITLGNVKDDIDILEKMINYLKETK